MAGPKEAEKINSPQYKLYRVVTKSLLSKDCPTHFIKNKILLASSPAAAAVKTIPVKEPFFGTQQLITRYKKGAVTKRRRPGALEIEAPSHREKRQREKERETREERDEEEEVEEEEEEEESEGGHFI